MHSEDVRVDEAAESSFLHFSPRHMHSHVQKSSTLKSGCSDRSISTDDEDGIYTEPYSDILRPIQSLQGEDKVVKINNISTYINCTKDIALHC